MRALEVPAFGGAGVLRVVDRPEPVPGRGEVLVRVEAVGLNWSDLLQREGVYVGGPKPPFISGQEAAGVVIAHGPGVTSPAIGATVAVIGKALAAERAVVPATSCIELSLPAIERAALPIAMLTAYHALVTAAHAQAGETVLIHAAAGGLGTIAVQVARCLGLRVIATCSPAKRDAVAAIGADLVCDYADFAEVARGVDIVIDSVGGAVFRASCESARPLGRIVIVGCTSGEPQRIDALKLMHRSLAVIGFHLRAVTDHAAAIAACKTWLAAQAVRPQIARVLPLDQAAAAHALLASRETVGKIVMVIE